MQYSLFYILNSYDNYLQLLYTEAKGTVCVISSDPT